MRVIAQRVAAASVQVDGEVIGAVDHGYLLLVGIGPEDTSRDGQALASKLAGLRVFADADGNMNLDIKEVAGKVLAVSQFTLLADTRKGRRPSFIRAAAPEVAEPLFDEFVDQLRAEGLEVETGRFGAKMAVTLINDGPVTMLLETEDGRLV